MILLSSLQSVLSYLQKSTGSSIKCYWTRNSGGAVNKITVEELDCGSDAETCRIFYDFGKQILVVHISI